MAKGPAEDEWCRKILPQIKKAAESKLAAFDIQPSEILYQWDNATHHMSGPHRVAALGIDINTQIVPQPPQSPDFQRIIENVHGAMATCFGRYLRCHPSINTMHGYKVVFGKMFHGEVETTTGGHVVTAKGVESEMRAMDAFYDAVIAADGGWPQKQHLQ